MGQGSKDLSKLRHHNAKAVHFRARTIGTKQGENLKFSSKSMSCHHI